MKKWLKKITLEDSPEFSDFRIRQKLYFYLMANFVGIVAMVGFGISLIGKDGYLIPMMDFICSALLILAYVHLRLTRKFDVTCLIACFSFMGFLLFHIISGGTGTSGPLWCFIFPPAAMYLLGSRRGLVFSLILAVPALVILILLYVGIDPAGYTTFFLLRFLISYLMVTFLFYLMEVQKANAQQQVEQLTGLLPICANCKKIRDDKGYWNNLETYIEKHSGAQFSHSICRECMVKLYGDEEWFKKESEK